MEDPNEFHKLLRRILSQEPKPSQSEEKTHIFRVIGILTFICIITVSCSATEDLSMSPLYTINKYSHNDNIHPTLYRSQLLIAKELGPMYNTVVTLEKYAQRGQAMYSIEVQSVGSDWRYMDEIILIIDGEIKKLTDDDPIRILKSDSTDFESISCFLDEDTFKGLRYCESLEMQYYHRPVTIPQEGLEAIWNFLKE